MRSIVCLAAAAALALPALAQAVPAPRGWSETADGPARVLTKGPAEVRIGPWQSLGGKDAEAWLNARADTALTGDVQEIGPVKPESKTDAYTITRKVTRDGQDAYSVLYACLGDGDAVRLMQMDSPLSAFGAMMAGGTHMEKVCKREAVGELVDVPAPSTKAPAPPDRQVASAPAPRPDPAPVTAPNTARPAPGTSPAGLQEIRGVLYFGINVSGIFTQKDMFIGLFDDGTYTRDLSGIYTDGVAASRAAKPKRWGQWRMANGELELRDYDETEFDTTQGDWLVDPARPDQRLEGCFGRLNYASSRDYGGNTSVGAASSWCFWPDGRFSNSASSFGTSPSVVVGSSRAKQQGRYRLDGNTAHFVYDNGETFTTSFGFTSEDNSHILLNGVRRMGRAQK